MADNKTILQTLQAFSQKLEDFSQRGGVRISTQDEEYTNLKNLQNQINQQEEEKREELRSQFQEFLMPVTQDIEKDEEDLVKAYTLFCQLKELNENSGDRQTHLKRYSLSSPVCHKSEYTSDKSRFAFLRLWFLTTTPDTNYVPEITADEKGSFSLDFTELELWQPSTLEKEIMQAFED